MAEDIFQHDDRVVDQAREGQRQAAEDHRIDRVVAEGKRDEGGQRGERNGEEDRDGRAEVAEENQDHQPGQDQADGAFVEQVLDGGLDEDRLVEDDVGDERLRHVEQLGDGVLDAVDDRDGVGIAALLQHRQIGGSLAVDAHDVRLNLRGILARGRHRRPAPELPSTVLSGSRLMSSMPRNWLLV